VPGWLRTALVLAAVVGGAVLLWLGLALLMVGLLIVVVPFWLWSLLVRRRVPAGPVTLEGSATRVDETVALSPQTDEEKERRAGLRER
jgi:Na+-transporting methylmalonyl-CoA/oxaloacetate decarboxylase gamma subunit